MLRTALLLAAIIPVWAGAAPEIEIPSLPSSPLALEAPKAVLFDWDGTIANEIDAWHAVLSETSKRLNLPVAPKDEVERTWVTDRGAFFERYFPGKDPAVVRKTFVELMAQARGGGEMDGRRFDGVQLLPGAVDSLDALRERGIAMAVVSNKSQAPLDAEVDKTGLRPYFARVQGHAEGREMKPSPQPITEALTALGVDGGHAWYVGNEPSDVEASLRGRTRPVLIDQRWRTHVAQSHPAEDASGGVIYVDGHAGLKVLLQSLPKAPR